ncbi:hypothetical protein OG21DRAFT_1604697 [Imleria badia]|nr:hypothetical protein OG21DRAFT_1604697 [Imleria badia]
MEPASWKHFAVGAAPETSLRHEVVRAYRVRTERDICCTLFSWGLSPPRIPHHVKPTRAFDEMWFEKDDEVLEEERKKKGTAVGTCGRLGQASLLLIQSPSAKRTFDCYMGVIMIRHVGVIDDGGGPLDHKYVPIPRGNHCHEMRKRGRRMASRDGVVNVR